MYVSKNRMLLNVNHLQKIVYLCMYLKVEIVLNADLEVDDFFLQGSVHPVA